MLPFRVLRHGVADEKESLLKIQIHRGAANLRYERKVSIRSKGPPRISSFGIDPQEELGNATGHWHYRHHCVVSFASGLKSAGHDVFIKHLSFPEVEHISSRSIVLEYHLLGLIVGNGRFKMPSLGPWHEFCNKMKQVPYYHRPDVLRFTAEHYFNHPGASQIEPIAPLGLLI